MKAAIYHETGDVDVIKYEDTPDPEIGENDVLIRVRASSLNHLDLRLRSGKSPRPVDLPHIGGVDIAGNVEKIGSKVKGISEGTRVVVDPVVESDEGRQIIGVNLHGGFAEYVKVPAENAVPIPDELSYDDASTLPICYLTAWYGLIERGRLRPGETVLVHAAGSGTGSAAVQVAKLAGAYVIATAGSDDKLETAENIGADETINYSSSDFAEEVGKITDNKGVDLIFDQVGGSFWEDNIKSLSPGGRILLIGVVGGVSSNLSFGPIIIRELSAIGVTVFNAPRESLKTVVKLAAQGRLSPVIDKKLPLEKTSEAQKYIENRNQFGKVILNP